MKLLQILNEIEVRNIRTYRITVRSIILGDKTIAVYPEDLKQEMNWDEATEACEKLGDGWRLPTLEELKAMYNQLHIEGKGNFKNEAYWSSSQDSSGNAWVVFFSIGVVSKIPTFEVIFSQVRAVRSLA